MSETPDERVTMSAPISERSFSRSLDSPLGPLYAVASLEGLRVLQWRAPAVALRPPEAGAEEALLRAVEDQLAAYFAGERRAFDVPLDPVGTEFQRAAWSALRRIPYGETRTYAEQAAAIGRPRAVRAIGAANGRNPIPIIVPCHRVIGSDGTLTGFAGGLEAKRFLLALESSREELELR